MKSRANPSALWPVLVIVMFFVFFAGRANAAGRAPDVNIYDTRTLAAEGTFRAYPAVFQGGASVAAGDVDGDGTQEIVTGAGVGGGPQVRVFSADGTVRSQFFAYDPSFRAGLNVAACDLDGNGTAEIVTGARQGGGPHVRIFDTHGTPVFSRAGFFAFDSAYRGGVNLACGDVDGDGMNDIVIGVGVNARPQVRVFDRFGTNKHIDIQPFADSARGGVSVAVANVDGGPAAEIVTAPYRFDTPLVRVFRADAAHTVVASFDAWPDGVRGGYAVAGGDVDGDGFDEIVIGIASGAAPHVRAFEGGGQALRFSLFPYEKTFDGGVMLALGDVTGDGRTDLVTAPGKNIVLGDPRYRKSIEVSIAEQRLFAYENGVLSRSFLVSTGVAKYPTPPGSYRITAKIPLKDYEWSYGPNHPDNYDIKDVKDNLRFAPTLYLHYAFWHHRFGHPMSHGCVNIDEANADWIYAWAEVGTPVLIR